MIGSDALGFSDLNRPGISADASGSIHYGLPAPEPYLDNRTGFGVGLSLSSSGTVAPTFVGGHAELALGGGFFSHESRGPGPGGFASYGTSASVGGFASPQNPPSSGSEINFNPHVGLYSGGSGGVWLSNARCSGDLRRTLTTFSCNIRFELGFGASLFWRWHFSIDPNASRSRI